MKPNHYPDQQLDVTGLDPWRLLAALHNASRPSPAALCRALSVTGDITPDQAQKEVFATIRPESRIQYGAQFWPDYLFGRPIKTFLMMKEGRIMLLRIDLYNRDIGAGAAQRVVEALRAEDNTESAPP